MEGLLPFSILSPAVLFVDFLMMFLLTDVKRYLIVILICISLVTSDVKYILICLLGICVSSLEKCLFRSFVHFWLGCFLSFFLIELCELFVNFGELSLAICLICKYFLPFCRVSFPFVYDFHFMIALQKIFSLIRSQLLIFTFISIRNFIPFVFNPISIWDLCWRVFGYILL